MNLDFALVNRALRNIGQAPLTQADKKAENEAWQTAREYYLSTMREALAQVEWTGAKRRRELTPAQMPYYKKNRDFAHVFCLPLDCAKPVELDGQGYFEVEANLLYTDESPARLLYVSDGKRLIDQPFISGGNAFRRPTPDCITGGDARRGRRLEWGDGVVSGGGANRNFTTNADTGMPQAPPPPEAGEDFPDYRELELETYFCLHWEYVLSSKYALRLTGQPGLADSFFAKAAVIGRNAQTVSISGSAGRRKAPGTWQEQLGLR